ncbi:hypothetical protein [Streptomyces sp. NBC_00829]|uniref:hypothetical protein n=1 Tax=Streptomyces sp. NBC_00829 TaxID=2903679 RepID=UPI00386E09F6|nr:hypothetical protein OG293_37195 [Streptomyces sp. NBC_00829]
MESERALTGQVPTDLPPGLHSFRDWTVEKFVHLDEAPIDPAMQERHRIYSMLLMSIVLDSWNGNKYGEVGDYGQWRADQRMPQAANVYRGGSYLGHNIAALAVDAEGRVIDYDFNHNEIFDSSVEHAESRLVRRVFALNQVYDQWEGNGETRHRRIAAPDRQQRRVFATAVTDRGDRVTPRTPEKVASGYSTLLSDVTVYTSLESCAQCTGIMCLASVKEVVYLQPDAGQFLIGNIMRRATKAQSLSFTAPRPIPGKEIGLRYYSELTEGAEDFAARVRDEPFFQSPTKTNNSPSVTSYLCTDGAYRTFQSATVELSGWSSLEHPDYRPDRPESALSNRQVLGMAKDFLEYVKGVKNRGTSHRV